MSFVDTLGLRGNVPVSGRGFVVGKASGVASGQGALVGFANAGGRYWALPDASTGNFSSPAMKPGTHITATFPTPAAIFRIGNGDGTPAGFKNSATSRPCMLGALLRDPACG